MKRWFWIIAVAALACNHAPTPTASASTTYPTETPWLCSTVIPMIHALTTHSEEHTVRLDTLELQMAAVQTLIWLPIVNVPTATPTPNYPVTPVSSPTPPVTSSVAHTASQINAGYDARRAVVLSALLADPGGNLWHAASKGLVGLYAGLGGAEQAVINLDKATGSDGKCAENCVTCGGGGAGYWSLPLLIRAYYTLGQDKLPETTMDKIRGFYRSYLSKGAGHGYGAAPQCSSESTLGRYDYPAYSYIAPSDNHNTIQASTILLSAQMLRGEGVRYAEIYEQWLAWWLRFLDVAAKRGFWETGSPTYVERHLAPIYNLYDFAEDATLRAKAKMLIDWYWAEVSQELLYGVRGGAKLRVYGIEEGDRGTLSAANDTMYAVFYLYFGDNGFESHPLMPNSEMYSAVFATSGYRVPDVLLELGANPEARGSYEIKEKRKGSCFYWDQGRTDDQPYNSRRYAYVTPDYILGSFQTDADKQFSPLASMVVHLQNSLTFATSPDARIMWGERGYISSGQINVFQHKNVVIASKVGQAVSLSYYLPPTGVLDTVQEEDGWVFVQEGNAYAAIKSLANEVIIIEAARAVDYGFDFAKFKAAVKQAGVSTIGGGFIEYTTTSGDVLYFPLLESDGTCRWSCNCEPSDDRLPSVNGTVVYWAFYPLFDSPFVRSEWDSGLVEVEFAGRRLTLNFGK